MLHLVEKLANFVPHWIAYDWNDESIPFEAPETVSDTAHIARTLPNTVVAYKRLPSDPKIFFTPETLPKQFLARHNTKAGVWAVISVRRGELEFTDLDQGGKENYRILADEDIIVKPRSYHSVKPMTDDLEMEITFYK